MKKFFLFFFLFSLVALLTVDSLRAEEGIIAQDKDEELTWSERDVGKLARAYVRPGLGKGSVVEYFGDAHQKALVNEAKQAGCTPVEAQALLDKGLVEKRQIGGKKALTNFYVALDAKRAEKEAALVLEIKTLKEQVAKLQPQPQQTIQTKAGGDLVISGEPSVDYHTSIKKMKESVDRFQKYVDGKAGPEQTTASVSPTSTGTKTIEERVGAIEARLDNPTTGLEALNNRVSDMDRAWEQTIQETHQAIRQVDRKVKVVNAKTKNLEVAETYLHSSNEKERQKGLGLLYLARNGQFRTKNAKDAQKYSTGLQLPNQVDEIDINAEVLPAERKDSAPADKNCK
ncbi:MAG: hypothetical protein NTZ42_00860 [Candidatus Gribaldobacteria bacterium]|nr:hypothetical protein [Candidatus Gribaldobacteria bacterium]